MADPRADFSAIYTADYYRGKGADPLVDFASQYYGRLIPVFHSKRHSQCHHIKDVHAHILAFPQLGQMQQSASRSYSDFFPAALVLAHLALAAAAIFLRATALIFLLRLLIGAAVVADEDPNSFERVVSSSEICSLILAALRNCGADNSVIFIGAIFRHG